MRSVRRGPLRRLASLLAVALAAGLLQASSCDDNLGHVHPAAVNFRVSVGRDSIQANGASWSPSISGDGRYVVFASDAKNLALPTSAHREIFFRDRESDTVRNITRLAFMFDQTSAQDCDFPFISGNGDWVVFLSKGDPTESGVYNGPHNSFNVFRWDRVNNTISRVLDVWPASSAVETDILNVSISDDGNYVAFQTSADSFGFTTGGDQQVFLADFSGGLGPVITLLSKAMGGPATQGGNKVSSFPRISSDGQFVAFQSKATDLTADPTNNKIQIFLAARDGSSMALVSRADGAAGATADFDCLAPTLSGDARYIAFTYAAPAGGGTLAGGSTGPRVLRRDRSPAAPASATTVVAGAPDPFIFSFFSNAGFPGGISDDGRFVSSWYVIKDSLGTFVDLKVGVQDLQGPFVFASQGIVGTTGATLGTFPLHALSADGRWVVFMSLSETQVLGDTNAAVDIFGYGPIH